MSGQKTVVASVSGVDTVIGESTPSALTVRFDLDTTANAPGSGIDRGYAVRTTRALLGV